MRTNNISIDCRSYICTPMYSSDHTKFNKQNKQLSHIITLLYKSRDFFDIYINAVCLSPVGLPSCKYCSDVTAQRKMNRSVMSNIPLHILQITWSNCCHSTFLEAELHRVTASIYWTHRCLFNTYQVKYLTCENKPKHFKSVHFSYMFHSYCSRSTNLMVYG